MTSDDTPRRPGTAARLSRRHLLLAAAAGGVAATAPATRADAATEATAATEAGQTAPTEPFYGGAGQAGVMTPPQRCAIFMAFDLTTDKRQDLQVLLARWSGAIAELMQGRTIGQVEPGRPGAVGLDTGEALGLGPSGLTVTIGLGPEVFTSRFGLEGRRPALLRLLSQLPSDALRPGLTGGDLSLQACADDPQVAYHAIRDLARIAKQTGSASTRWMVTGFGRASAGPAQETPRNLFGFRDGTRNLRTPEEFDRHVWLMEGPDWQRRGTYQVVRKIEMRIENWDTAQVRVQNDTFGRHKLSGAPLGGQAEFDPPDFGRRAADGSPVIPANAHIRLAAHENNDGIRILRRSFNYTEGINEIGALDAGLLFISYQNDPAHFERLQARLGAADALNEYISHIGSGLFFVPPAAAPGSYIGAPLFA